MYYGKSENKLIRIVDTKSLLKWWPFFKEGIKWLQSKGWFDHSEDIAFKTILTITEMGKRGYVAVITSKNGKPLAFGVAYENTPDFYDKRSFLSYITYSNNKDSKAYNSLLDEFKRYAKGEGINILYVSTRRCCGSAIRCFNSFGFLQDFLIFKMEI